MEPQSATKVSYNRQVYRVKDAITRSLMLNVVRGGIRERREITNGDLC